MERLFAPIFVLKCKVIPKNCSVLNSAMQIQPEHPNLTNITVVGGWSDIYEIRANLNSVVVEVEV